MSYKLDYKKNTYKLEFSVNTTSLTEAKIKAIKLYFEENCNITVFIYCDPNIDDFVIGKK